MKLRLPKLLMGAIVALGMAAQAVTLNPADFKPDTWEDENGDSHESDTLVYKGDSNMTLVGRVALDPAEIWYYWHTEGAYVSFTGAGTLATPYNSKENPVGWFGNFDVWLGEDAVSFYMDEKVTIDYTVFTIHSCSRVPVKVNVDALFRNGADLALDGNMIVDINDARFEYATIEAGAPILCDELVINEKLSLEMWDGGDSAGSVLYGNLTLAGGAMLSGNKGTIVVKDNVEMSHYSYLWGGVIFHASCYDSHPETGKEALSWDTFTVTGNMKVTKPTGIWFQGDVDLNSKDTTGDWSYRSGYQVPTADHALFVCGSVDAASLSLLQAYSFDGHFYSYEVPGFESEDGESHMMEWLDYIKLDGKFVAQARLDGKVGVYFCQNGQKPEDFKDAATIVTDTQIYDADASKPYYIEDGGVIDASGLAGATLSTDKIAGMGGELKTSSNQTLENTTGATIAYSVTGGANLSISGRGYDIMTRALAALNGERYEVGKTTVQNALLEIGANTILGSANSTLEVQSNASVTNFGTIQGSEVSLERGSTLLNQGQIDAMIKLANGSVLTNNCEIAGDVVVESGAAVYGTGTFGGDTLIKRGAMMHVGNSPGYMVFTGNLTFDESTQLSFSVDGIKAADKNQNGPGYYSNALVSGSLTLNGEVAVKVEVTGGLVAEYAFQSGGSNAFILNLLEVDNPGNITVNNNGKFVCTLAAGEDLLENYNFEWDETTGTLTFSGQVAEDAIKAYEESLRYVEPRYVEPSESAFADTLWASTGALKDMVDAACNQLLIGAPGQTTVWGSALGTYIKHDDFSYSGGGYAVGLQHAYTENFRAGVSLGRTYGDFECDDYMKSDQTGIMTAFTMQYVDELTKGKSAWGVKAFAAYGCIENDATTTLGETAEWNDHAFTIGTRAHYCVALGDSAALTIFAGLEYMSGWQQEICLTYGRNSVTLEDGRMQSLSIPLGITLSTDMVLGNGMVFAPELSLAYVVDVMRDDPSLMYGDMEVEGSSPSKHAFMLNVGANLLFDENWSAGLFYNLKANGDVTTHSGNVSLRYSF